MDTLIDAMAGQVAAMLAQHGLTGLVVAGLVILYWRALKRIDVLTDRLYAVSVETIHALDELTRRMD